MMGYTTMQHQRTDNHEYYQVALVEKDLPANASTRGYSCLEKETRKAESVTLSAVCRNLWSVFAVPVFS